MLKLPFTIATEKNLGLSTKVLQDLYKMVLKGIEEFIEWRHIMLVN